MANSEEQSLASLIISIIILIIVFILIIMVGCNMYNTNNANQSRVQNPQAAALAAAMYNKNQFCSGPWYAFIEPDSDNDGSGAC